MARMSNNNTDHCRVACFTDTFGNQSNNGVGRFIEDLKRFSNETPHELKLFVPTKETNIGQIFGVRAPSFTLPIYSKVALAMPLEHHRKSIRRELQNWEPDLIHVSTPGPFGMLGLSLAKSMKLPVAGIYHTDFPQYAREIAYQQCKAAIANPFSTFGDLISNVMKFVGPYLGKIESENPKAEEDFQALFEIFSRNFKILSSGKEIPQIAAEAAEFIAEQFLSRFYANFETVIARSTIQQHQISNRLKIPVEKVRVLTPGTDLEKFSPSWANRACLSQFDIPEDAFVSLYVGRVTSEKNISLLIDVWEKAQAKLDDNHFLLVVGYGDDSEIEKLKKLKNVRIAGPKSAQELSTIYATANLLLLPSVTETLGQVGLESLASATPVLAANRGGQTSYIETEGQRFSASRRRHNGVGQ